LAATKSASRNAASDSTSAAKKDAKPAGRDPVALAFALPRSVTLNAQQQKAYDRLKSQNASTLRSALAMAQSQDKQDRAKGLQQSKETRAKIKSGIKEILAMPAVEAQKNASAYAAQQRAAASSGGGRCPCGKR
jgi:hypothetical protein